jgi:glycosyltransferase involved in cell wall biosynthesis
MDKKIKLGINLFFNNNNNSGIVNYIYNIISALKTLPANEQPIITVFHSDDAPIDYIKSIGYPAISFMLFKTYSSSRIVNGINKISKALFKTDVYLKFKYFNKIDVLYPYFGFVDKIFEPVKHKIYWLVDFNNRAYPSHYADNGEEMLAIQTELTNSDKHIVLSSKALLNELKEYYPNYKNKVSVLNFACSLPDLNDQDIDSLLLKFNISKPYFMSPNQFWEHKNQLTLIKALTILKETNRLNFKVVFTGSMSVNRGKGHILSTLQTMISDYGLNEHILFLGIVDRNEQLALMKNANGLIQPSLYEGWSTLVEEAKALNNVIVLSNLPVHIEQECVNSYFFDPHNADQLAALLVESLNNNNVNIIDYSNNINKFGYDILNILKDELQHA